MAQLNSNEPTVGRKSKGVKGRKILPTKVDMTPMVDLAFLLITFFIFTATMNEPNTMDLVMPKDGPPEGVKESGALTIILGKNDTIHYYQGNLANETTSIQTATTGTIRDIIIEKKKAVEARYNPDQPCEREKIQQQKDIKDCRQQDFFVIIKPTKNASYKQVINLLDEMTINRVLHYALANLSVSEMDKLPLLL